jgi:hypothetical protein
MIVAPVTLIQLLPISLTGWGVREAVLVVALASFGVPAEAALARSVLLGLCLIASGLPGGLIWLGNWDIAPSEWKTSRARLIIISVLKLKGSRRVTKSSLTERRMISTVNLR